MYPGLAVGFLLNPFFQTTNLEIYGAVFLGCLLTMVLAAVLSFIFVNRLDEECL